MKTLIELYVNEGFDDLAAMFVFMPERVVFLCCVVLPGAAERAAIRRFAGAAAARAGKQSPVIEFVDVGDRSINSILSGIKGIFKKYEDCAVEMTGGPASLLVAAERFCERNRAKAFYFDDLKGRFRSIYGMESELADQKPFSVDVRELILLGGSHVTGNKHSTAQLERDPDIVRGILDVYCAGIGSWNAFSEYLQFACRSYYDPAALLFCAPSTLLNNHTLLLANKRLLEQLEKVGALRELSMEGELVSFRFANGYVRDILTTIGMCLELFVYVSATECARFDSAEMSVEFDWDGNIRGGIGDTSNEIDVILTKGFKSFFVSCKTARPDARDLYEISYLARRFGGRNAQPVIATAADLSGEAWALYARARDMGVAVIERNDIRAGMQHVAESLIEPKWYPEKPETVKA